MSDVCLFPAQTNVETGLVPASPTISHSVTTEAERERHARKQLGFVQRQAGQDAGCAGALRNKATAIIHAQGKMDLADNPSTKTVIDLRVTTYSFCREACTL